MKIILQDESPTYQPPRRLSVQDTTIVEVQVKEWLRDGIIRPSSSDFASPVVVTKKKDGSHRLCVDFRQLNKKIIKDRYPLPIIDDQINMLQKALIFSSLDLKNGFFHVKVEEASRKYTAFVVPNGHYEFERVPFGLCTSPAVFQKYIHRIFKELMEREVMTTYMDDFIVLATTVEEGLERLQEVLNHASQYGLQFKWKKCQLLKKEVEYLGYVVGNGKVQPSPGKTLSVERFEEPRTIKKLQSYLGLTSYFRKFVFNYSVIAKPLSDLLKKDKPFIFKEAERQAFQKLKDALLSKPVLKIFEYGEETELHTDASKFGYGAILMQKDEDRKFHPVYYYSRKTTAAEQNYCSYELEVLAVVMGLKKFSVYLHGHTFKLVTDCKAFTQTMKKRDLIPKIARWAMFLESFDYKIEHRSGSRMKHVDSLSRNPVSLIVRDSIVHQLQAAQNKDGEIQAVKKVLETSPYEGYTIRNNLLYKEVEEEQLLVVPRGMQAEIIKSAHEQGHFAVRKTVEMIQREFYIPRLQQKVTSCIKNCVTCILASRKEGKQEGYLNPIPKEDVPLGTYHIDHLGPMTITKKKYKHLLVIVDAFSKFVWIYPTKSTTSEETLQKLRLQQEVFGNPDRIISDKGTAFTSNAFRDYCRDEKIQHVTITTGVPRGNGQVERINRVIISVLAKLSLGYQDDWYKHVGKLQKALNGSFSRSTKSTPFELMFGVRMKGELALIDEIEEEIREVFQDG